MFPKMVEQGDLDHGGRTTTTADHTAHWGI
jgi:hypothetical protein